MIFLIRKIRLPQIIFHTKNINEIDFNVNSNIFYYNIDNNNDTKNIILLAKILLLWYLINNYDNKIIGLNENILFKIDEYIKKINFWKSNNFQYLNQ